jgi:subtilisin family serine protease
LAILSMGFVQAPAGSLLAAGDVATAGTDDVVVFDEGFTGDVAALIERSGGVPGRIFDRIGVATARGMTPASEAQLRSSSGVLAVEPDLLIGAPPDEAEATEVVVDPATAPAIAGASPTSAEFYPRQWNLRAIHAPEAWASGNLGSSQVSAFILDTGIDYLHPDLVGLVDLSRSKSLVSSYSNEDVLVAALPGNRHPVTDLHSHGTAIAGLIASNGQYLAGVTQRTTLVSVKVHDRFRMGPISNYIEGIVWAAEHEADLIHLSVPVEFNKRENPGLVAAVNRAANLAWESGAVMVAAAGNLSQDLDHDKDRFRFCNTVHVICASATAPTAAAGVNGPWTDVDAFAPYTNYGRSTIDVAGPGGMGNPGDPRTVWLVCSRESQSTMAPQRPCRPGAADPRRLIWSSTGTSFGAGATSGLAAMLISVLGKDRPDDIRAAIERSALDLGAPGNDPYYGNGRIDVEAALLGSH